MVGKDRKIDLSQNYFLYFHWRMPKKTLPLLSLKFARVAELVDALDSKSSDSNIVPVRPRPRVLYTSSTIEEGTFVHSSLEKMKQRKYDKAYL